MWRSHVRGVEQMSRLAFMSSRSLDRFDASCATQGHSSCGETGDQYVRGGDMSKRADVRIGISGWRYKPWRGVFYPKKLPQRLELNFASRALPSIEINGSFYALQTPNRYAEWYAETP